MHRSVKSPKVEAYFCGSRETVVDSLIFQPQPLAVLYGVPDVSEERHWTKHEVLLRRRKRRQKPRVTSFVAQSVVPHPSLKI